MAEFLPAYEQMISNEGGYKLHQVADDRGGMTYAGIARNRWPSWSGWRLIDAGQVPPVDLVQGFYQNNFWNPLRLDGVSDQAVARSLFDFAVNAGVGTATRLAQTAAGTTPDGVIGSKTLDALNAITPELFLARFALAKLARYEQIVSRDRSQERFLLGWVRRTLKEAA